MSTKVKQAVDSVTGSINAILSILDGTIPLSSWIMDKIGALNPLQFVLTLLQRVVGYDRVVEFLTETIVIGLPSIEDNVKISLIESLKNLFSCSVNPLINEAILREGIVLDLSSIDLLGTMKQCPLNTIFDDVTFNGTYFYFDVDRFIIPDQLENSTDLNAVIWFAKNRSSDRTVWYGSDKQNEEHENLSIENETSPGTLPSENNGLITLEYSEKSSWLKDSVGNEMSLQVPHGNCLHVFLGNSKGITDEIIPSYDEIVSKTEQFKSFSTSLENELNNFEEKIIGEQTIEEQEATQGDIDVINKLMNSLKNGISISSILPNLPINEDNGKRLLSIGDTEINISDYAYNSTKEDLKEENKGYKMELERIAETYQYMLPQENYYFNKTLFEFNADYIKAIKLFDSKVLAIQIINLLTGCFDVKLNLSFEERLVRNEVEKMIQKIINSEDITAVSDCFFTFSNDEYNLLLDETEKERIGKYTGGEYGYGSTIDYSKIYKEINAISNSATLSEQISNIEHAFNEISRTIKPEIYQDVDEFSINFDFLNNLLMGLMQTIVYGIISPKFYMLIAINLKIMGKVPNFDLAGFISSFKSLLLNLIKSIVDSILSKLNEWLVSIVKDLIARLSDRLLLEQYEYYIQLLMKCIRTFRRLFGNKDWNMADVEYADIVSINANEDYEVITNTNC